jgi:homocysteine S-methyltransferase
LWSAQILREDPDEIAAVHDDFFRAGARVATTASYQLTFEGMAAAGGTPEETERLLRRSVEIARAAADSHMSAPGAIAASPQTRRWVAASIGPYGAGPGRGTEYDGDYGLSAAELAAWHRPRIGVLADSGADVLLAETVPSILEVEALAAELEDAALPAMLSVTVADGRLRDGTPLPEMAPIFSGVTSIRVVGVNCCQAEDALAAVRTLSGLTDLPLIAYPNSGERWDHAARCWAPRTQGELTPLGAVPALVDAGVRFLGGCCRVTPREIAAMAEAVGEKTAGWSRSLPIGRDSARAMQKHPLSGVIGTI